MTVKQLAQKTNLEVLNLGEDGEREISGIYCCDLLSVVMSKGFSGACWVTIMGNINAAAVASLTDMACIVLADGTAVDEMLITKARQQDISVLKSDKPIFETALEIHGTLNA